MGAGASCFKQRSRSKNYHFSGVVLNGNLNRKKPSKHHVKSPPSSSITKSSNQNPPISITLQSGKSQSHYDGVVVVNKGFELPLYDQSPFRVKHNYSTSTESTSTGRTPLTDQEVSSFFTDSLLELPDVYYEYSRYSRPLSCHL